MCEEKPNLSDSSSPFVSGGCVNFKLESLRSQAGSVGHKRAADPIRVTANPREAVIPRALDLTGNKKCLMAPWYEACEKNISPQCCERPQNNEFFNLADSTDFAETK